MAFFCGFDLFHGFGKVYDNAYNIVVDDPYGSERWTDAKSEWPPSMNGGFDKLRLSRIQAQPEWDLSFSLSGISV